MRLLAESGVAAVCLPLCALYLDLPMPPARALADAGARVVLATDFNPGSAPSESMLAAMNLACTQLKLSCAEALHAATIAPAAVLGLAGEVGQLALGFAADIVLIETRTGAWPATTSARSRRASLSACVFRAELRFEQGSDPETAPFGVRPPQIPRAEGARIARRGTNRACFGTKRALRGTRPWGLRAAD